MVKKLKLTKKKKRWVEQFKPTVVMRGSSMPYSGPVQQRYIKDIKKLMLEVFRDTEVAVKQIYSSKASKEFFAMDVSIASTSRIMLNELLRKVQKVTAKKSETMVKRMLNNTDAASKSSLFKSLKDLSGGLNIKTDFKTLGTNEAITSSFNANVDLIVTMTSDYVGNVRQAVYRSIQEGEGLETLIPKLDKFFKEPWAGHLNKAKNVALDQTRKAYTAITAARMEKVGVDKFEWIHGGGGKEPRAYHKAKWPEGLNGGIFSLSDPPIIDKETGETGLPGQLINDTCFMRPIIEFNEGVAAA